MKEEHIEVFIEKYINDGNTVSIGTSDYSGEFLKKLALKAEKDNLKINFLPTSAKLAQLAAELKFPIVSFSDCEVDVAIEFVDSVDKEFNFIKLNSESLIRDKMIAQSSLNLIIITKAENFQDKLERNVLFEISSFGHKRTLAGLENFGKSQLRMLVKKPFKTETNNYMAFVEIDEVHNLEEVDFAARRIPGVLETGIFYGMADTLITLNGKIEVKTRLKF